MHRSRLFGALLCGGLAVGAPTAAQEIDVVELTIEDVLAAYAAGSYTAVELTQAFLDRIDMYESHYNAFISMNPDALEIAAELDRAYAAGGPVGPLHGVPVVIKDNIDYGGLVTTAGWEGFSSRMGGADMIPDDDAAVVTRLREAGAIILGKTNLPDFAGHGTRTNSTVAGETLNPYDTNKVPGGSSGGTATAVNASFGVFGLGTETGGSIQNPSSAQALVGVKPTYGLLPIEGIVPLSGTYVDVVGPMSRTVYDAAVAMDVMAGPTTEDLATFAADGHIPPAGYAGSLGLASFEGKRFGLVGPGWRDDNLPLDSLTEIEYRAAVDVLTRLGATVVEDPFEGSGFIEAYDERTGVPSQGTHDMHVYMAGLGPNAPFNSIEGWEAVTGRNYRAARAAGRGGGRGGRGGANRPPVPARPSATEEGDAYQAWRHEVRSIFRRVLEDHDLDGLFFPQSGEPNRPVVEDPERLDYTPNNWAEIPSNIINDLGVPVVTVPFSYYDDGTPFVIAWIGDSWTEAELLGYAYLFELATRARRPPELTALPVG